MIDYSLKKGYLVRIFSHCSIYTPESLRAEERKRAFIYLYSVMRILLI